MPEFSNWTIRLEGNKMDAKSLQYECGAVVALKGFTERPIIRARIEGPEAIFIVSGDWYKLSYF